jgi:c-di-GMP-binding flagellar brake protein YcgR
MKLSEIASGTKLELRIYDHFGDINDMPLISEFEWLVSEEQAFIAAPIFEGNIYPVQVGAFMDIFFVIKSSVNNMNGVCKFRSKVLGREKIDNIALLLIENVGQLEEVQRRDFYRCAYLLPIKFSLGEASEGEKTKIVKQEGLIKDLSGGGVCIRMKEKIELGQILDCEIALEDKAVEFSAEVVRVDKVDNISKYNYEIGISFKIIKNQNREELIKFIFSEQRKLRKKGLI